MNVAHALTALANQLWSLLAPLIAALQPVQVVVRAEAETASTDGQRVIILPPEFEGVIVSETPPVAVGLLAHELAHFLQPLEAVQQVQRSEGAPPWLSNVLLDIHGETLLPTLFPGVAAPLEATRRVVGDRRLGSYRTHLAQANSFPQAVQAGALVARFRDPGVPFAARRLTHPTWPEVGPCLRLMARVGQVGSADLPAFLAELLQRYPALRQAGTPSLPDPIAVLGGCRPASGLVGVDPVALAPPQPGKRAQLQSWPVHGHAVDPQAARLARQLVGRFTSPRGAISVVAPGRFDRRAAARGVGVPFRMALPGSAMPAPALVIAVDSSGSMWGPHPGPSKLEIARRAAQALALAIRAAGGEVVGVLFDDAGYQTPSGASDALLFAPLDSWPQGGTDFGFLPDLWQRYPTHQVLVLTDGRGNLPAVLAAHRRRTAVLVIPPGDAQAVAPLGQRVVTLTDLAQLPWLMGLLVPRARVG